MRNRHNDDHKKVRLLLNLETDETVKKKKINRGFKKKVHNIAIDIEV
jgi:hypothetical protein